MGDADQIKLSTINNTIIYDDQNESSSDQKEKSKRGRPSMNWDEFYLEVTERFLKGGLPEKQDSFIADMQKWCLKHWGHEPGRSTVLQKISPYYNKFIRK